MKKGVDLFDVPMGAYDGTEVCEFFNTFLWEKSMNFVIKVILDYIGITVGKWYSVRQNKEEIANIKNAN